MKRNINVGILTNKNDFLLKFLIQKISNIRNIKIYLFFAENKNKKKDLKIFKERTGSYFFNKKINLKNSIEPKKFYFKSHNSLKFFNFIKKNKIQYILNSYTPNKINNKIIQSTKGIINFHPAILPNYRGCTTVEWTLLNKDPLGITAHLMDNKYDAGPIIKIKYLKFKKKEISSYKDVRIKIYLLMLSLVKTILIKIAKKKLSYHIQDSKNANFYPVMKKNILNKIKNKIKSKNFEFNKKNYL